MGREKPIPVITPKSLLPPYDYPFFTFGDEANNHLRADDPRHGLGLGPGKDFSMADAWWLAEAAMLSYDDLAHVGPAFAAAGFPHVELISDPDTNPGTDTDLYVAHNDRHVVVAFRGSESGLRRGEVDFTHILIDFAVTDAKFVPVPFGGDRRKGQVHGGFQRGLESVWTTLTARLESLRDGRRLFWFTGHSLGGALATLAAAKAADLAAFDLRGLYTCGSPRVGDATFKSFFEGLLRDRYRMGYYRFVYQQDLVTTFPPPPLFPFTHAGTLKQIRADGEITDGPGMFEQVRNFFGGILRRSFDLFGSVNPRVTILIPEQLKQHVPTFYTTHIWNAHARQVG
jgi:triacylglycerol lipase